MKICRKCKEEKERSCFSKMTASKDGLQPMCKQCRKLDHQLNKERDSKSGKVWLQANNGHKRDYLKRHYEANKKEILAYWREHYQANKPTYYSRAAKRRTIAKQATPVWSEASLIKIVYENAAKFGFHVDHIVPLNNDKVCGLHVWHNLQLLAPELNLSKSNREWPDMP